MTKQLLLVRHAQAEAENNVQKDFERELNTTGYADASRMGKHLAEKSIRPDAVFSSPAHRAFTTSKLLTEQLGFDFDTIRFDNDIYETSVRKLMRLINGLNEKLRTVMIVGHNPHLTYFAEFLTHEVIGNIPTCGVVAISFENLSWEAISDATGKVAWFDSPEKNRNAQ